jgi:hypothetical protein
MVYKPLIELEEINTRCRIQLTKTLDQYHRIRSTGRTGEAISNRGRGLAFFVAFEPWSTSLRCPPGSARFFDLAEKQGSLSPQEASDLSQTLIRHGIAMSRAYNGAFSPFFSAPHVRTIFSNVDNLQHLSESALAVGGSWADRLYEASPAPLQPEKHLEVQSFRQITIKSELDFYSQTPWLAWVEALDLICLCAWAGIRPSLVMRMVKALEQKVVHIPAESVALDDAVFGRKVVLPMFSRGLQGAVVGLFTDVPKEQMEPILTTLMQFGETLSDVYADLRWKHFIEALEGDLNEHELAREIINAISPVAKIVVTLNGRKAGYKIGYENSYWCGFESLSAAEMAAAPITEGFSMPGPGGAEIYIEPLTDIPHINPHFMSVRLENYLAIAFETAAAAPEGEPLSMKEVQQLLAEYAPYADGPSASFAKLREYFVVAKVAKHWDNGAVRVTNNEVRRFFEERGRDAKNGYQVTSFVSDFEKIFAEKVTVTKTRDALSLTWLTGE